MEFDSSVGNGAFPVAIIGAACRFPGASNLEEYWSLLKSGADAIGTIPPDRWDVDFYYNPDQGRAARMYTKAGGFSDRPYRFDAEFFGISPREAAQIDPQQRIVLELAWDALESAGIVPARIAGGETGVVIGVSNTDYSAFSAKKRDHRPLRHVGQRRRAGVEPHFLYFRPARAELFASIPPARRRWSRFMRPARPCGATRRP